MYTTQTTYPTTPHNISGLATVKERLNNLRNKAIERLNLLINNETDRNVIYKYSDYIIEDEPFEQPSHKLKNIYMSLALLDDNNLVN